MAAKKKTRKSPCLKPGRAAVAKKTAKKHAHAPSDAMKKKARAPGQGSRRKKAGKKKKPGKILGATTLVTEDLIDFIVHKFALGLHPFMIREAVVDWVEYWHPERPLPSRTTIDKAMTKARIKIRKLTNFDDAEALLKDSAALYDGMSRDPRIQDLVRLKSREAFDGLLGIGAKYSSTFLSPEGQAARALEFLRQARERRSVDDSAPVATAD